MSLILPRFRCSAFVFRSVACLAMSCATFWQSPLAHSSQVQPIDWSKYSQVLDVQPGDGFGQKLAQVIQKHAKYTLQEINSPANYLIQADFPGHVGLQFYWPYTRAANNERSIRPLSNFAYGTAVMLKTGIYDPNSTGVSTSQALNQAVLAINGIALTHRGNGTTSNHRWGGGGYGRDNSRWQAGYWAAEAASAAWMLWDDLPNETRQLVEKMVEYEANSFINYQVPYWRNLNGTTNYPGDTKGEENSWNAMMPALAQAMMPKHANVNLWRSKASELMVSAYSVRSDNSPFGSGAKIVDGKPVHQWVDGYNMFSDGVVINHHIIQPDYMIGPSTIGYSTAINASLAGQYIPESTFHNIDLIYRGLTETEFVAGPSPYTSGHTIVSPGGTIYQRIVSEDGTKYFADVYYPNGAEWVQSNVVMEGYLNFDLYAEFLGLDAGKDYDAMGWAEARLDRLIEMQARSGSVGNLYQPGDWLESFFSEEQSLFMSLTQAWMQHWLISNGRMSPVGEAWTALPVPEPSGVSLSLMAMAVFFRLGKPTISRRTLGTTFCPMD